MYASMRPRRRRRGELRKCGARSGATCGFNAATPTSAWRTRKLTAAEANALTLQCGHADVGVENGRLIELLKKLPDELQCGHADVGVENSACRQRARRPRGRFNAATPTSAWRT